MRRTERTPGSVSPVYGPPPFLTYQSRMRPTNGEIRNAPASAAAMACTSENSSVRLQSIRSRRRISAARIPSQVDATLMRTFSRGTRRAS
jgi:hypothetical protein